MIASGGERAIVMRTRPDGGVLIYAGLETRDNAVRQSLEEASGPDNFDETAAPATNSS